MYCFIVQKSVVLLKIADVLLYSPEICGVVEDLDNEVQGSNAQANCEINQANHSSDKCSLADSQDEIQKANYLTGVDDCGGSSCSPPGKPSCLTASLKYLDTNALSMGNKQEELETCVQSLGHDLIATTET
ncbi:run domain-containing protein 3b [Limosa lapponica baueri]|uniref:Run domain-containing protein 3b n=1 Tax=Limosa lapponica baueri TaxID=1758121 RepID=A0A2I0TCU2_LIMLA|nr:run domain-containing protein 3b [Limosa lapponica baueri]